MPWLSTAALRLTDCFAFAALSIAVFASVMSACAWRTSSAAAGELLRGPCCGLLALLRAAALLGRGVGLLRERVGDRLGHRGVLILARDQRRQLRRAREVIFAARLRRLIAGLALIADQLLEVLDHREEQPAQLVELLIGGLGGRQRIAVLRERGVERRERGRRLAAQLPRRCSAAAAACSSCCFAASTCFDRRLLPAADRAGAGAARASLRAARASRRACDCSSAIRSLIRSRRARFDASPPRASCARARRARAPSRHRETDSRASPGGAGTRARSRASGRKTPRSPCRARRAPRARPRSRRRACRRDERDARASIAALASVTNGSAVRTRSISFCSSGLGGFGGSALPNRCPPRACRPLRSPPRAVRALRRADRAARSGDPPSRSARATPE